MRTHCLTCRWWRDKNSDWDGSGECHRYPPKTAPHSRVGIYAVWVETTKHDWCGEHAEKQQNTAEEITGGQ